MSCTAVSLAIGLQQKLSCSSAVKDAETPRGKSGGKLYPRHHEMPKLYWRCHSSHVQPLRSAHTTTEMYGCCTSRVTTLCTDSAKQCYSNVVLLLVCISTAHHAHRKVLKSTS
eukprot:20901-Heterococcus_DN1.PRE.1